MDLAIGQVYGEKYRIVRLLGQGSMGAVYEGENVRIRRKVAIKTLHQGMAEKGDTLQRFEREAQAAGRIGSRHICEVLDMGDLPDGSRYMVMEHLDGVTLQQHIRSMGRLKPLEVSPILQQLLDGLGAAHAAGIIHRDLKPANVFLVRQPGKPDFVKILDFGVSKFSVLSDEMSMTRTGAVLGTPYYMSPEQAKGSRGTDARSDLYAVGVILYECITGQVPFSAETFNELLFRIVLESPPPAESFVPDLPPELAAIIRKSMAREPADRFQTAEEFKQALADWSAKAEAEASPQFDGLATLDAQTVMRVSPFAQPGLRPAPPSTTASGSMVMDGAAPPQPAVASLGTVIIDPAVVPAGNAPPAANGAARGGAKTAPLPQWGTPGMMPPPTPMGAMQGAMPAGMPGAPPAGAPMPAPGYANDARGMYPAPVVSPPGQGPITLTEAVAPRSMAHPSRRPMRVVAFVGIATGLLLGVGVWAVLWRHDGVDAVPASALSTSVSPALSSAPASQSAAPAASSEVAAAGAAAPSAAPTSEPAPTPAAATAAAAAADPAPKTSGKVAAKTSSSPTATAAPTAAVAADAPTTKPAASNPSGKRTVSQDL